MNKPANLIIEDTKENLTKIINESGLPPFLIEPIVKDIYNQVYILKQEELEKTKVDYEERVKKEKKGEKNNNG